MTYQPNRRSFLIAGGMTALASTRVLGANDTLRIGVIGAGGRMIKAIGIGARRSIERELGTRVHLELSVRVRRHWRADEHVLDQLGIE